MQLIAGENLAESLRQSQGDIPVWQTSHLADNIIANPGNVVAAQHVSLHATRFLAPRADAPLGTVIADTGIYVGNCGNNPNQVLLSITSGGEQAVANHNLTVAPL